MNPDHADHDDDDMPRAVEHALLKHNALGDELCRAVAGEVWEQARDDYDRVYGLWQDTVKELAEARRERDALREMVDSTKVAAWDKCAEIIRRAQTAEAERDRLREALLNVARMAEALKRPCSMDDPESAQAIRNSQYMNISYAARDALEGKP